MLPLPSNAQSFCICFDRFQASNHAFSDALQVCFRDSPGPAAAGVTHMRLCLVRFLLQTFIRITDTHIQRKLSIRNSHMFLLILFITIFFHFPGQKETFSFFSDSDMTPLGILQTSESIQSYTASCAQIGCSACSGMSERMQKYKLPVFGKAASVGGCCFESECYHQHFSRPSRAVLHFLYLKFCSPFLNVPWDTIWCVCTGPNHRYDRDRLQVPGQSYVLDFKCLLEFSRQRSLSKKSRHQKLWQIQYVHAKKVMQLPCLDFRDPSEQMLLCQILQHCMACMIQIRFLFSHVDHWRGRVGLPPYFLTCFLPCIGNAKIIKKTFGTLHLHQAWKEYKATSIQEKVHVMDSGDQ